MNLIIMHSTLQFIADPIHLPVSSHTELGGVTNKYIQSEEPMLLVQQLPKYKTINTRGEHIGERLGHWEHPVHWRAP